MTVLSAIQRASTVIGLDKPSIIYSSTEREHIELGDLANEMAERIASAHDWTKLTGIATITGDGSTTAHDLPSDYDRMIVKTNVWSSSLQTPLTHIADLDEWLGLEVWSYTYVINAWTIYADQMHIKPALASSVTAQYWYQSNLLVSPASGSNKTRFTADDDTFRLDERLLTLGIIWQWRANKGLAYAEDLTNYEEEKEKLIARDKGSRMIRIGGVRMPKGLKTAYPQNITVS